MPKVNITVENGTPEGVAQTVGALFGRNEAATAAKTPANGASLSFGTLDAQVEVRDGDTVASLFGRGSGDLGMEAGRALTFQNGNGEVIPADSKAVPGESYTAVPNHDPKG